MSPTENRLARETSPYLRQHRFDPVDWFPYGDEAFAVARETDRPVFLSIGYSACHWCHVMAHESFSDPDVAAQMRESVVAIKVDREERPDVDAVYMEAVLAASGHGGWPMSVFATPDGRPFFAGTYFPDRPRQGMPSFRQVLAAVADVWQTRRADVEAQADSLLEAVKGRLVPPGPLLLFEAGGADRSGEARAPKPPTPASIREALKSGVERLCDLADSANGGFGGAPKFPQPLLLDMLLRAHVAGIEATGGPQPLEIVVDALEAMCSGGIYDHLGGGFSRYSVDAGWLVPHFEKMLYDQALLARVLLHTWQVTGDPRWRLVLDETLGYVLGRLRHRSGAICSSEDADSEGEEGRYYLWTMGEIEEVVGRDSLEEVAQWWGITPGGNFEGRNILHRPVRGDLERPPRIERARAQLAAARERRIAPGLDDKVLTEWNAMAASVLAEAAAATGEARYARAALEVMTVLQNAVEAAGGSVPRLAVRTASSSYEGGFAVDAAWFAYAALTLFELDGELEWLERARRAAIRFVEDFVDEETGVVYAGREESALPARAIESTDSVVPSAASVGVAVLAKLSVLYGDEAFATTAARIVRAASKAITTVPTAVPELLRGAALLAGTIEIVGVGAGRDLLASLRRHYVPTAVYLPASTGQPHDSGSRSSLPLLEERTEEAVYICRFGSCRLPARDLDSAERELLAMVNEDARSGP